MMDEVAMQYALRQKLATLAVATTGVMALSATATGYARTAGSFLVDGFDRGMEFTPAGFATNATRIITGVSALDITVSGSVTPEITAGGRSLTAGLPSRRSWENAVFQPTAGAPWVREELLPGPVAQTTLGPNSALEGTPMYVLHVSVAADTGLTAKRYVNALRVLFAPNTLIPLPNGDILHVRADVSPYAGQLQQSQPGFAVQPFYVPLRVRSFNTI